MGVLLREPSTYLCVFRRKLWKTPNGYVDKHDQVLNLENIINLKFEQNNKLEDRWCQVQTSGRACRPSRSEFSIVFSETRVNMG